MKKPDHPYLFKLLFATTCGSYLGVLAKSIPFVLIIFSSFLSAQDARPTLAVINFEARGIATRVAQILTDRFSTSIGNTGVVRLVERRIMIRILYEQEFQLTGCTTDECAVEVGKLLDVQNIVGGTIEKVGDTYTIDARMISVETGELIRTRSISYVGKVDGLIVEIENLAYEMMDMKPPKSLRETQKMASLTHTLLETQAFLLQPLMPRIRKTRIGALIRSTIFPGFGQIYAEKKVLGYGWILSELVVGGLVYASYTTYQTANDEYKSHQREYDNATDPHVLAEYRALAEASIDDMNTANDQMKTLTYAGAGLWLANMIHAYMVGPQSNDGVNSSTTIHVGYDPNLNRSQLRLSIALD